MSVKKISPKGAEAEAWARLEDALSHPGRKDFKYTVRTAAEGIAAARIAELEAALEETMEALDEALPYVMDNIPEEELVGWRKRHIDYAREVLRRAAATLKGDADAG